MQPILVCSHTSPVHSLRYNDTAGQWEISNNTSTTGETGTWDTIATSAGTGAAGGNTQIQFNSSGVFAATANLIFDSATNRLGLVGHQTFGNIVTAPAVTANAVALYHNQSNEGSTGLYVRSAAGQDELISAARARLYAIIF